MSRLEQLLAPQRRLWLLGTIVTITVMYSWSAVNQLAVLIEAEPELPDSQSLLQRAEQNIASHLHLPHGVAKFRGMVGNDLPEGVGTKAGARSKPTGGAATGSTGGRKQGAGSSKAAASSSSSAKSGGSSKGSSSGKAGGSSGGNAAAKEGHCQMLKNTDYWGDALIWGHENRVESAQDCCNACQNYKPTEEKDMMDCNVWVYCEDPALCGTHHKECWLKHLAHPYGTAPAKEGPEVGWTTGILTAPEETAVAEESGEDRTFHVIITAAGSPVHWQSRVGYYWYLKTKKQCQAAGKCQMGGFTRILHTGEADDLMNEIPTWVAQPLPPEHPDHGYVVLNRPYALKQWVEQVTIPEKYVLMSEPDHVWLKPMPNLMKGQRPAAFPFFYIEPSKKDYIPIVAKFVGPVTRSDTEHIAPIGNAPTMMAFEDMKKVMPIFFNMSIAVHNDPEAAKEWGWVQEMYAFTLSCYKAGIRDIDLHLKMMAQPPYDEKLAPFYILHYTYGMDYTLEGVFTPGKYGEWRFDKRSYSQIPPPRNLGEPPTGMKNELVRHLIHAINEATSVIPGWDDYAKTGVAKQLWDGVVPDK